MSMMTKIEEVYKSLCDQSNPLYFDIYSVVKSRLEKSYLPYVFVAFQHKIIIPRNEVIEYLCAIS